MTLKTSFQKLNSELSQLAEATQYLHLLIVEDNPEAHAAALVDVLSDAVDDLTAELLVCQEASAAALQCIIERNDLYCLAPLLTNCQAHFHHSENILLTLLSHGRITSLRQLGRERGGEWLLWSQSACEIIERLQEPVQEVKQSLFDCWQNVLEHALSSGPLIQNTAIGLKVQQMHSSK